MADVAAVDIAARDVLAAHFVMWHEMPDAAPFGEWRCACGAKFGFSDSAIDHQAAEVSAWLTSKLAAAETVDAVAKALSVGEMTAHNPEAHPDHNHWSWLGTGHGDAIRDEFRSQATAALGAVAGVLTGGAE